MATFENLLFKVEGAIATLTINRPQMRNALNDATIEEIAAALDEIELNPALRVLIVTGSGDKAFVAGADIHELKERDTVRGRTVTRRRQEVFTWLEELPIPSIAAINGFAMGAGLELAMACTLRLASSAAKLGQPEVKLGITPGAGGTQRLPRIVGMGRAMEMILTGEPIDAAAALSCGLVNRVVAPEALLPETLKLAETLIARPRLAVQYAKEAVLRSGEGSLAEGMAHESYLHALSCGTEDKREGVEAFLQKREPKFTGR
jgi:enoyl-CoA hydratase